MKNYCEDCKTKVVMHAFSFGNCYSCREEISTSHIPCDKLCEKCSYETKLCQSCGNKIEINKSGAHGES